MFFKIACFTLKLLTIFFMKCYSIFVMGLIFSSNTSLNDMDISNQAVTSIYTKYLAMGFKSFPNK